VPADLVAQSRVDLGRERLVLPGREAGIERGGDRRRRHVVVDRLEDRPAALAGVLDVAADLLEAGIVLERPVQQVEQPGAHDRPVAPDARDLVQVEAELGGVQQLEALAERLHHPVLDAVVDHLDEVAGAGRADVGVAVLGREALDERLDDRVALRVAADHHAVTLLQPPDAARDAGVHVVDALLHRLGGAALRVVEVRVAAVDDGVAVLEQRQ
jgi:hypothetical protein